MPPKNIMADPKQLGIIQYANVSKEIPLNVEKWICIYPAYIDQDRTLKEGRRLSKENCTKFPDAYAIYYVCAVLLKLQVALESKRYSKSWWDYVGRGVGRCKVNLLNDNGERNIKDPTSDIIFDSRKTLFKRIATLLNDPETKIPKNFRPKEQEAEKIAIAEEEKLEKASGAGGNRKKKKKKKKRR